MPDGDVNVLSGLALPLSVSSCRPDKRSAIRQTSRCHDDHPVTISPAGGVSSNSSIVRAISRSPITT
ncbi:TPA_asm: hypothetical protein G1455_23425 [Salmonella enterica]|uniref:Uncharacterized protein n=1 Tax=Salmonella enterica TaxID=28901 RepID=A0A723DM22_SALER|nr:hypothetical protein AL524_25415 [Citrobacter amalonaticus]HAD9411950.1 hypothetical protein [Salmonella enterica]